MPPSPDATRAFNIAIRFLKFRPRSEREVVNHLSLKHFSHQDIESTITRLKSAKFLDDREFARLFLERRLHSSVRSLKLVRKELIQKGVSPDIIDQVAPTPAEFDLAAARHLLSRRLRLWSSLGRRELRQKCINFLIARGFPYDQIKPLVVEMTEK